MAELKFLCNFIFLQNQRIAKMHQGENNRNYLSKLCTVKSSAHNKQYSLQLLFGKFFFILNMYEPTKKFTFVSISKVIRKNHTIHKMHTLCTFWPGHYVITEKFLSSNLCIYLLFLAQLYRLEKRSEKVRPNGA